MFINQTPNYRIVVVGDTNVGKTTAIIKFCKLESRNGTIPTVGLDFFNNIRIVDSVRMNLQIWDTPGHVSFLTITKNACRNKSGAALFFDLTKRNSFSNLENWINTLKEYLPFHEKAPIVIFGNKCDLSKLRTVSEEEAREFAERHNYSYFETSSATGENLDEAFLTLFQQIIKLEGSRPEPTPNPTPEPNPKPHKCC